MRIRLLLFIVAVALVIGFSAAADPLITAKPEEVGFSGERLKRLGGAFQAEVDQGKLAGAVLFVARHGKVAYFNAVGFQDREKKIPMKTDAIFRIASMTKPIVSVGIMMLVEEGKLQLITPVSTFIPEFKDVKVGVEKTTEGKTELVLEPPRRPMTIQDLLRHTSGLTYGQFGDSLVKQAYRAANLGAPGESLSDLVKKLAQLPLAFQPGTTFEYSMSTDVLGRVIEVVSGIELDRFITERITRPLGMPDTGFYVAGDQTTRVAEPQIESSTGKRPPIRDVSVRPSWMSGGGGMVSTAADYARFCQMLLNGGELESVRLLSPRTVAYMTSDHLPPETQISPTVQGLFGSLVPSPALGQGFGLGFAVRTTTGRNPMPGSAGEFYWTGAAGTTFWVNPAEGLIAIMMVQVPLPAGGYYRSLMRNMVYQAFAS
jgi:CubicO group peptidase (beta-lactamase class C family)